jgi:hypothetical protein
VPPDKLEVPPNMSDRPLPLPECSRMNTIRNRLESDAEHEAMTSGHGRQSAGPYSPAGFVDDRSVLEREVAGATWPGVVRPGSARRRCAGALRVRAPWVETAA